MDFGRFGEGPGSVLEMFSSRDFQQIQFNNFEKHNVSLRDPPELHFAELRVTFGRHWDALGRLFGISWRLWGVSWTLLGFHGCFSLHFGWVWGGTWEGFGKIWAGLCESFG